MADIAPTVTQGTAYPGLLNLVYMYLDTLDMEIDERQRIESYLDLIRRRTDGACSLPAPCRTPRADARLLFPCPCHHLPPTAWRAGSLRTAASWIREFVRAHPKYRGDSVVSQEINYDLMVAIDEM